MHKYRLIAKKGEGTFSEVLKAQCIKNGKYVAIKCMKNHFDSIDQVNNLREIQALRRLSPHPNIIKLLEVLYDQPTGRLALIFELMDMNIYELIRGRRHYVAEERVQHFMYQLMKALDHMHRNGIFHRDIKPENILIMDDCLKLADFGSCRGIYSKQPYTEYISTRWYRAPECLLTDGYYNYKMDMWGVGCVMFEVVSLYPLFPGANELDQMSRIHAVMGTPPPELLAKLKKRSAHMSFDFPAKEGTGIARLIPHVSPDCLDLIQRLLAYDPDDRISARQALKHPYFRNVREREKAGAGRPQGPLSSAGQAGGGGQQQRRTASKLLQDQDVAPGGDTESEKAGGLPSISVFGKPAGLNGSFTLQQQQQQQQQQQHKPGHGPGHGPPHHKPHGPAQHGPQQQHHDPLDGPAGLTGPQQHRRTQQGDEDILPGLPEVLAGTFGGDSDALAGTVDKNTLPPINQSFGGLSGKTQPLHHAHSHNLGSHAAAGGHHGGQHGQGQGASTGNSTSRRMSQSLPAVGAAGHHHQQAQQQQQQGHQPPGLTSEPSASKLAGGGGPHGRAKGGGMGGPGGHVLAAGKVSRAQANAASTLTGGFGGSLQANLSVSSIFKSGPGAGAGGLKASGSCKYVSPYSQRSLGI